MLTIVAIIEQIDDRALNRGDRKSVHHHHILSA